VLQALYFDLRKGAHSIGSNVRDAAAYVLWALARTQNSNALVPHAEKLAQRLMAVALFDREVHIRRAASAAFQEHVGRTVGMNLSFGVSQEFLQCFSRNVFIMTEFISTRYRRVGQNRFLFCQYSQTCIFNRCTPGRTVSPKPSTFH